jgi:hypothetical protein
VVAEASLAARQQSLSGRVQAATVDPIKTKISTEFVFASPKTNVFEENG